MKKTEDIAVLRVSKKERYIPFREKKVPIRIDEVFKIVMGNPRNQKYF